MGQTQLYTYLESMVYFILLLHVSTVQIGHHHAQHGNTKNK